MTLARCMGTLAYLEKITRGSTQKQNEVLRDRQINFI